MWSFLQQINEAGTTIILTTHYLEEAESLCRHIGIIDRGQLIEMTTMASLLGELHTESFVLNLQRPVQTLPDLNGYQVEKIDETTLVADVFRGQTINGLFQELSHHNLIVTSMRNKANRLEQLFIGLVNANKLPVSSETATGS